MDVRVGLWRRLSAKELMLLTCGVGEDSWESLGLQGDPASLFRRRSTLGFLKLKLQYFGHLMQSQLIGKDPDAGKDWGQEEKGMTEDEMAGWHHRLNGHGFGWTLGVGDGQGGLACCSSGVAKSQIQLNDWTELNWIWGIMILEFLRTIRSALTFSVHWISVVYAYLNLLYCKDIFGLSVCCKFPH